MRRRFLNSGGAVETFTAYEVTDAIVNAMHGGTNTHEAIGTVIMWDYEDERFRAFAFDDFTRAAIGAGEELMEYEKERFLPYGILLYGRNVIETARGNDAANDPNSITCVSLLSYDGVDVKPTTPEATAYFGELYRQQLTTTISNSISIQKDTSKNKYDTSAYPLFRGNSSVLTQASTNNSTYGYSFFQTTEIHEIAQSFPCNLGTIYETVIFDGADIIDENRVFANNGYSGNMPNGAIYSPFIAKSGDILKDWCYPDVNANTYVYDGRSKKMTLLNALSTSDVPTLTQYIDVVKAFVNKLAPMNLGRYAFRIPTLLELRMLFARLGRITEVEIELMNQGLITHPIATLFNYGENALPGLGGVVLSSTKQGAYHMGIQGLSARFVGVANTSSIIPPVNMYCIPFFRFTSDMFV